MSRQIHFPDLVANFLFAEHASRNGLADGVRVVVFEVEVNPAGVIDDLFAELVGVGRLVLIAEDIKDLRVMTGLNVTIAGICLKTKIHALTGLAILNRKLPFHLPASHTNNGSPPNG